MNTFTSPDTQTPAPNSSTNPPTMPMQVRIALGLIWVDVLISLYQTVHGWSGAQSAMPGPGRYAVYGFMVGGYAILALIVAGLVWRKNWARIVYLVITLIGLAGMYFAAQFAPNTVQLPASDVILNNVHQVIGLVVVYLLFATQGRHWFRRDEPEHV